MPLAQVFGRNVRAARLEHGLTQEELAKLAGLHQSVISDLEHGRNTTLETVERVADALRVDRPALLADSSPRRRRA